LTGSDAKEAALVDQWVAFVDAHIASHSNVIIQLVQGVITPYNKPVSYTQLLLQWLVR
jgi:elongation factor 1-gamma